MAGKYEETLKILQDYKDCVEKDLAEIRRCKSDMEKLKDELIKQFGDGLYVRDDKCIILSAPEIIIGDVNRDGTPRNTNSKVIVRTDTLTNEVDSNIKNKARRVEYICSSPNPISNSLRATPVSSFFTVQAEAITLLCEKTSGTFATVPKVVNGEINIMADEHINIAAQPPLTTRKEHIDWAINYRKEQKDHLKNAALPTLESIKAKLKTYDAVMDLSVNDPKLGQHPEFQDMCNKKMDALTKDLYTYDCTVSELLQTELEIQCLTKEKEKVEAAITRGYSPSVIDIKAGTTNITSKNAENKMCTYNGAGINLNAKETNIVAHADQGGILDGSYCKVHTQRIYLSTANPKQGEKAGEYELNSEGQIALYSKDISMTAADWEKKGNDGFKKKALTQGGRVVMHAENVVVSSVSPDGKAIGNVKVSSQNIDMRTIDFNPENGKITGMAENGSINILAPNIVGGCFDDKFKDKSKITFNSSDIAVNSIKRTEITQDKGKAMLQLNEGKACLKAEENDITGILSVNSSTSFNNPVIAETVTTTNLVVSSYMKSPNSQDGAKVDKGDTPDPDRLPMIDIDQQLLKLNQKADEDQIKREKKKEQEERIRLAMKKKKEKEMKEREEWEKQKKKIRAREEDARNRGIKTINGREQSEDAMMDGFIEIKL